MLNIMYLIIYNLKTDRKNKYIKIIFYFSKISNKWYNIVNTNKKNFNYIFWIYYDNIKFLYQNLKISQYK